MAARLQWDCAQSHFWAVKSTSENCVIHYGRAALAWMKKNRSLKNEKLKANRASETAEKRKERLRITRKG